MSPQQAPTGKRDKLKSLFQRKTSQPQESSNNVVITPASQQLSNSNADIPPRARVPSQKAFVKSKMLEKDIAVLSATYALEENPELKKLIYLIVVIHDMDEDDRLIGVLEICAQFSVQLASATESYRAEATEAITEFMKTVEQVDMAVKQEGDTQSLNALTSLVDDEIVRIKSMHQPFARDHAFGTSVGLSKVLSTTIGASITVLDIVKEASSLIPLPWVKPAIEGVVVLLKAVQQTRTNYDDMKQIAVMAGEFVISCAVIYSEHTMEPSRELKRALNKFTKTLENIAEDCDKLSQLNPFWRYLQQSAHSSSLQEIRTRLHGAISLFQTESDVIIQLDIKDLSRKIDYSALNSLPNHPHYVRNDYLSGTRDDVLGYISGWIDKPGDLVLWMHGAAGLGKSTVGQQLAHLLKDDARLAGGIFLTSLTTEAPEIVVQMISRQLGEMHPRAIGCIADATRRLNGPHNLLEDYFTAYIIDPLRELQYPYKLVIIIDGLEEWKNHESFLAELAHIPSSAPLKLVLTSRPSHSIERVLNKSSVQPYSLPLVSQEIVERYFNHHFKMIDWRERTPDQQTINRLAIRAQGLLVWAATVRSLLSHEYDNRYPHEILNQILWSEEKVATRSGEQLEHLYRDAIFTLFPKPEMREMLQGFIGGMMVLQEALPIHDFASLVGISDRPAEEIRRQLAALQIRGSFKSDVVSPALHQFHVSFLEFIESTTTKYDGQPIAVSSTNSHLMLANRCLEIVFSELCQSSRGQTCVYSEIHGVELYAIKFWPLHLSNGSSRLPAAPSASIALIDIPEEHMRRWATLFLPCVATRFQDNCDLLGNIPTSALLYEAASIIGEEDVTTLSYQLYCLEIAVRLQPMNVWAWIALGEAYHRLYENGAYKKNLDEEISVHLHALELVSQRTAGHGSLDDADIYITEDSTGQTDGSETDLPGYILSSVGLAHYTRFKQQSTSNDIDKAISMHQEALALRPAPHLNRSISLNRLAIALHARFDQRGASSDQDLDEAISMHREALVLRPAPHPNRWISLNNLASALRARFNQRGASSDLDEAISMHQEVLVLVPAPHPNRWMSLMNLANALYTRFEQRGASSDLDEAISMSREALVLRPAPHPDCSMSFNNLALALHTRFEQRGASSDLDEAISMHRDALVLQPAPHPDRWSSLNNLAIVLQSRFEQRGALIDLDKAISMHRDALFLRPAPNPNRPVSLMNLANALYTQFEQRGASSDIDEAISLSREALVLCPAFHPSRSAVLDTLANALQARFEQQGTSSDIDEAISLSREALVLCPAFHPSHSAVLDTLAISLQACFKQQGTSNILDEAISMHREALVLRPAPNPNRSKSLNNLADALKTRFEERGASSDIDEAILMNREALVLRPAPHLHRSVSLINLANALQTQFEQQGASNNLDEAILLCREALVYRQSFHPEYSNILKSLAVVLQSRYDTSHLPEDLDEAISLHRQLLDRVTQDPNRSWSLETFPAVLRERHALTGGQSDLDEAADVERLH